MEEKEEAKEAPGFEESERPAETESKDRAQEDETAVARGRAGYIARSRTKTWRRPPLFLSRPGPVWTTSIVSRFGRPFKTYDPSRAIFRAGGRLSPKCEAETLSPAESSSIALVKTLHFTMVSILFLSCRGQSESLLCVLVGEMAEFLRGEDGWLGGTLDEGHAVTVFDRVC